MQACGLRIRQPSFSWPLSALLKLQSVVLPRFSTYFCFPVSSSHSLKGNPKSTRNDPSKPSFRPFLASRGKSKKIYIKTSRMMFPSSLSAEQQAAVCRRGKGGAEAQKEGGWRAGDIQARLGSGYRWCWASWVVRIQKFSNIMERQNSDQEGQSNRYFLGNMPGLFYQQNPVILYQSEGQNPTYNIFTTTQQFSNSTNYLPGLQYSYVPYNPTSRLFISYQTDKPTIIRQAPRQEKTTNGGSTSSHGSSDKDVKQQANQQQQQSQSLSGDINSQELSANDPEDSNRKKNPNYYWSPEENRRYYEFVKDNVQWFKLRYHKRKNLKINVLMSNKVVTRTAIQCHSHHQKMMQKYKTVGNLLRKMRLQLQGLEPPPSQIKVQEQRIQGESREGIPCLLKQSHQ